MPLKAVRDKLAVHSGPSHIQFVTYPSEHDMGIFFVLDARRPWPEHPDASTVRVSARRLILDVKEFLTWYNAYLLGPLTEIAGPGCGN